MQEKISSRLILYPVILILFPVILILFPVILILFLVILSEAKNLINYDQNIP